MLISDIKICYFLGIFSIHNLLKIYFKTHQIAPHFQNFLREASIVAYAPELPSICVQQ